MVLRKYHAGNVWFLNCILTISHWWTFCKNWTEKSRANFFLNAIFVVLHWQFSDLPRPIFFCIFLSSLSENVNKIQQIFTVNHLIRYIYSSKKGKNKIRITMFNSFLCILISTPSLNLYFAIWTTGVHVFKILPKK